MSEEKKKEDLEGKSGVVCIEKRRFPRFNVDLPMKYSEVKVRKKQGGIAHDASEGGLLVYLQERFPIGAKLKIEVFFSHGFRLTPIRLMAEIVWADIRGPGDWGEFKYGLKFVNIGKEDFSKLKWLLDSLAA
ncbi:MAG: PilZ domain-containing protein [Syntrophobacterales bacterium]|nr:MAG: PilZ domain-containing protein [Syntrophobacterales bacterium]